MKKKQLLNSIGMIWQVYDVEWYRMYSYAKSYYEKYNHLNIHQHYRVDFNGTELLKGTSDYASKSSIKLGQWIAVQRLKKEKGILKDEYVSLLDSIGMVWNSKNNKEEIKKLCKIYGIDIKLNESILNKPYKEIVAKIAFLEAIGESVVIDSKFHQIFFMSDINMQITYNISLQDLVDKYASAKVKRI